MASRAEVNLKRRTALLQLGEVFKALNHLALPTKRASHVDLGSGFLQWNLSEICQNECLAKMIFLADTILRINNAINGLSSAHFLSHVFQNFVAVRWVNNVPVKIGLGTLHSLHDAGLDFNMSAICAHQICAMQVLIYVHVLHFVRNNNFIYFSRDIGHNGLGYVAKSILQTFAVLLWDVFF